MEFFQKLLAGGGVSSAIFWLGLTAFSGILFGRIQIGKIRLGVSGALFAGLLFGHYGATLDHSILGFVREFGLILFVYTVGIDVGPRFFSAFRNDGMQLNFLAALTVFLGFLLALAFHFYGSIATPVITGIMSGAVTNTPGLGAAQQLFSETVGEQAVSIAGMGYAISYPFGILGIILTMLILRLIFRITVSDEMSAYNDLINKNQNKLETVRITVSNPNLINHPIGYIRQVVDKELVISRIVRSEEQLVPRDEIKLLDNDVLIGVSSIDKIDNLCLKIGPVEIAKKREMSGYLAMFHVLVTSHKIGGRTVEQIGISRRYEANITRIFRSGIEIFPSNDTTVELGDIVRIVGKRELLEDIRNELGNSVKELAHPNLPPIFFGIFMGIVLGSIPFAIPGLPVPAKLGMVGGPLLVAILLGHMGRWGSQSFYMTPGANTMLREMGISLFLACVGLSSGSRFVETFQSGGYNWMLIGMVITFVPIFLVGIIARLMKINYLKICGVISGAMTDPPALEFANSLAPSQAQSTAYATVYPLTMFLRILFAQILVLVTM